MVEDLLVGWLKLISYLYNGIVVFLKEILMVKKKERGVGLN